jgi:DNA-binding NarL/FixJ family response regulator
VAGYVLKDEIEEAVVRAIRTVMQGDTWFSRTVVEKLARPATGEVPPVEQLALTNRELGVLRLVALGLTDKAIAQELSIMRSTVRFHLRQISEKLGLQGKGQLIAWALEHGLLTPRRQTDAT